MKHNERQFPNKFVFEAEKFNILIVEDSISMLKMLNQNFLDNKFNTFLASSLKEAREVVKRNKIDYIILDINLPDGSGYELIEDLATSSLAVCSDSLRRDLNSSKIPSNDISLPSLIFFFNSSLFNIFICKSFNEKFTR